MSDDDSNPLKGSDEPMSKAGRKPRAVVAPSTDPNPREHIGANQGLPIFESVDLGGGAIDTSKLPGVLNRIKAVINTAAMIKRTAAETMRDERRDFQAKHAEAYDAIESIRKSAIEKMRDKLRERPAYKEAEETKTDAAADIRTAKKAAKEAGISVPALTVALKMAEMDPQEREEYFDAIDMYCKGLRLWGSDWKS